MDHHGELRKRGKEQNLSQSPFTAAEAKPTKRLAGVCSMPLSASLFQQSASVAGEYHKLSSQLFLEDNSFSRRDALRWRLLFIFSYVPNRCWRPRPPHHHHHYHHPTTPSSFSSWNENQHHRLLSEVTACSMRVR